MMRYYIIVGEASGDLHGANLIRGIVQADPDAEFRFWGGDKMIDAANGRGQIMYHYKDTAVMGYWEVIKNLRRITGRMRECRADISSYNPDVLILIDYPGFNLRMAKFAKQAGIPVYYYIAPKVWAWKERRVKAIKQYVDQLFVIFPFEIEYFRRHGIEAWYGGNPIMDSLSSRGTTESEENFRRDNNLDNRPIVSLVAGSRKAEIDFNLPYMVKASKAFPEYQFIVTGVSWLDKSQYDKHISGSDVVYVCDKTYETISHSIAALVTSGTATLETALLGVPEVVCFRGSPLTMLIARILLKLKYVSLVNIIMEREVVRELLQENYTPESAIAELRKVLPGVGVRYDQMMQNFAELTTKMGEPGTSARVAQKMVNMLKNR